MCEMMRERLGRGDERDHQGAVAVAVGDGAVVAAAGSGAAVVAAGVAAAATAAAAKTNSRLCSSYECFMIKSFS